MKIVTGYTGTPHVTSNDMSAFQQGIVGLDDYFLYNGSEFTATATSGNTIALTKGELVIQGTHARVEGTESLTIDVGGQGMYRTDLVVAKYSKEAGTGKESCELVMKTGTPAATNPKSPTLKQDDIRNGGSTREVALFEVNVYGSVIQTVKRVIPVVDNLYQIRKDLDESRTKLNATTSTAAKNTSNITKIQNVISKGIFKKLVVASKSAMAEIKAWKSTNDMPAVGLCCNDAFGNNKSSLRLYSDGTLSVVQNEKAYKIPVTRSGKVAITPPKKASGSSGTLVPTTELTGRTTISFGMEFKNPPVVICTVNSTVPNKCHVSVTDVRNASCTVLLYRDDGDVKTTVNWVAIGELGSYSISGGDRGDWDSELL